MLLNSSGAPLRLPMHEKPIRRGRKKIKDFMYGKKLMGY